MKTFFTIITLSILSISAFASNPYKIESSKIAAAFESASQVSLELFDSNILLTLADGDDEPTKGGFLVRAYFCGTFGLHRSYMGTEGMFIKYCWNPIGACDFWYVVFSGDKGFEKFKDNDKWIVW
jgi:hypothetical protein